MTKLSSSAQYWDELAQRISNPVETKNKRPDTSEIEIEFLKKYVSKEDEVLDVGSGSGLIINKLIHHVKEITAVEKYEGFSKFIIEHPNMLVINSDLLGFNMRKQYDKVLSFGVSQCFNTKDTTSIYEKLFEMTKEGGKLIVRTHCGLEKDKVVNGYSEELKTDYFAEYRFFEKEMNVMREVGFKNIEKFDIFPDALNVWDDTRHFIFVCDK